MRSFDGRGRFSISGKKHLFPYVAQFLHAGFAPSQRIFRFLQNSHAAAARFLGLLSVLGDMIDSERLR